MKDRDEAQLEEAEAKEHIVSDDELVELCYINVESLKRKSGIIDGHRIIALVKDKLNINIDQARAYRIRALLLYRHPELDIKSGGKSS